MEEQEDIFKEDIGDEFIIINKNKRDVLNDMKFKTEEDKLICDSIITNLERTAAESIRSLKVVQLPYIGCIRINPVKRALRDAKLHLGAIRKDMTKEQYKEYVRSYYVALQQEQIIKDRIKLIIRNIKRANKKQYEELCIKLGTVYADLFIMSIYWLTEVPFDAEFEEHYQKLKIEEKARQIEKHRSAKHEVVNRRPSEIIKDALEAQPRYKF